MSDKTHDLIASVGLKEAEFYSRLNEDMQDEYCNILLSFVTCNKTMWVQQLKQQMDLLVLNNSSEEYRVNQFFKGLELSFLENQRGPETMEFSKGEESVIVEIDDSYEPAVLKISYVKEGQR